MNRVELPVIFVVSVAKAYGLINHQGLLFGPNSVLQNTPARGEHVVTLEEFSQGREITVFRTDADPRLVLARVRQILANPYPYNLFSNNCEHTVAKALNGLPESAQVKSLVFAGLGVLFLAALASK